MVLKKKKKNGFWVLLHSLGEISWFLNEDFYLGQLISLRMRMRIRMRMRMRMRMRPKTTKIIYIEKMVLIFAHLKRFSGLPYTG